MKRIFSYILLVVAFSLLLASNAKAGEREDKLVSLAMSGDVDGVRILLDQGVNINAKDRKGLGDTALGAAITFCLSPQVKNCVDVVRLLVARGADLNEVGSLETTPLTSAAQSGKVDIVRILIDKGANVNRKDGFDHTALMNANEVLQTGTWDGESSVFKPVYRPLTPAEKATYIEIVRMLIAAGAK